MTKRSSRLIEVESTINGENGELKAQSVASMMVLNARIEKNEERMA